MKHIRIASRGSKLALIQSNYVADLLRKLCDGIEISIVRVSTKGDREKSGFLYKSDYRGFFTSEVENALLVGSADMAVHSFKDLPTAITTGLIIAAIPKRETVADALVTSNQVCSIEDLPAGASIGTSSLRRIAQVKHLRDDLKCVSLRGNVETRVQKVTTGRIDAAIVACAGLKRLGIDDRIYAPLSPEQFLPAPAQGALAVQVRADDTELAKLVSQIDDKNSRITAEAERHILSALQGGCSIPFGAYSYISGSKITIDAMVSDLEGKKYIRRSKTTDNSEAKICAGELAEQILKAGGREILEKIRDGFTPT